MGEEASEEEQSEEDTAEEMTAARAARIGMKQISELIDKETLGVTSVESAEDGWRVGVEVLEDHRVPSSTDMLALYELQLSEDGTLQGYSRKRRYSRGSSGSDNGGQQ